MKKTKPCVKRQSSLQEIARLAGCSVSVVSTVANNAANGIRVSAEKRRLIEGIIQRLQYKPNYHARALRRGRSHVQAVIFPDQALNPQAGIFIDLFVGIKDAAHACDNDLLVVSTRPGEDEVERAMHLLINHQVDSLIVPGFLYRERLSEFEDIKAPVVIIGGDRDSADYSTPLPRVCHDSSAGIREAVQHLAALGHREILWVGAIGNGRRLVPNRRLAFHKITSELGLRSSEFYIHFDPAQGEVAGTQELSREQFARHLARHKPPTALMAYNEIVGLGIYSALQKSGLSVPEDVSVIGYDGHYSELAYPTMSVVSMEIREMGARASALALKMTETPPLIIKMKGTVEYVPTRYISKKSTASPRAKA